MERRDLTAGGLAGLTVFTLEEGGYEHCQAQSYSWYYLHRRLVRRPAGGAPA